MDMQMQAKRQASEDDLRLAEVAGGWQGLSASLAAEAAIGESYKMGQRRARPDTAMPDAAVVGHRGARLPGQWRSGAG
jgi:hypothetical protein